MLLVVVLLFGLTTCKKIKEIADINPEIDPLKQGFKTSAAIGYCASLAATGLSGGEAPPNVVFEASNNSNYSGSGIMYVTVNENYPLPFNNHIGDMVIAGLWDGDEFSELIR